MEKTLELVAIPILVAAVLGFLSLPVVKPKIFFLVFKPVISVLGIISLSTMVFGIGYLIGLFRAQSLIADIDASGQISGLIPETFVWTFLPAGACLGIMLVSRALVPVAIHQLQEEADKSRAKEDE